MKDFTPEPAKGREEMHPTVHGWTLQRLFCKGGHEFSEHSVLVCQVQVWKAMWNEKGFLGRNAFNVCAKPGLLWAIPSCLGFGDMPRPFC